MEVLNLLATKASKPKRRIKQNIEPEWLKKYPKITRAQAIQLFCRECFGYTKHRKGWCDSETWVIAGRMARECTDAECPLFRFRPGLKRGRRAQKNPIRRV